MYYIYKTTNLINGKTYIGQHKYIKLNDDYIGSGILLRRAIEKYGKENFKKEILYSNIQYKETADDIERFAINKERKLGKAEYNIADGGQGGNLGEDVNRKIGLLSKGRKPMLGKHHTPETCQRISEAKIGKHFSEEHKQNISEALKGNKNNLGNHHSDETRKIMSEKQMGQNNSFYGKKHSEESLEKMRNATSGKNNGFYGKHHDSETCRKISETKKKNYAIKLKAYEDYISKGGTLKWKEFQKEYSNKITNYIS